MMPFDRDEQRRFDAKRIADGADALKALQEAQDAYPELRIGQIIENAKYDAGDRDLFYIENDDLAFAIRAWTERMLRTQPSRRPRKT